MKVKNLIETFAGDNIPVYFYCEELQINGNYMFMDVYNHRIPKQWLEGEVDYWNVDELHEMMISVKNMKPIKASESFTKKFTIEASKSAKAKKSIKASATRTYQVEYNPSGYYSGADVWETLDEIQYIEADNAQEAIDFAKNWWVESVGYDYYDQAVSETEEYAWRAAEHIVDEDGYSDLGPWEFED